MVEKITSSQLKLLRQLENFINVVKVVVVFIFIIIVLMYPILIRLLVEDIELYCMLSLFFNWAILSILWYSILHEG